MNTSLVYNCRGSLGILTQIGPTPNFSSSRSNNEDHHFIRICIISMCQYFDKTQFTCSGQWNRRENQPLVMVITIDKESRIYPQISITHFFRRVVVYSLSQTLLTKKFLVVSITLSNRIPSPNISNLEFSFILVLLVFFSCFF